MALNKDIKLHIQQIASGAGLTDVIKGLTDVKGAALVAGAGIGIAVAAAGALVIAIEEIARVSFKSFSEAEFSAKSLEFALKNSNANLQNMLDLSTELQSKSMFSDETIQDGMTFLGLQGRNEDQIRKTTQAAVDFAAANKMDLQQSIKILDATYEGNIGKLGRLDSSLKSLTPQQLASGEAIDIIAKKYKGFAEDQATNTLIGQFTVLKNLWDDNLETIGSLVAQGMQPLLNLIKQALPIVVDLTKSVIDFAKGLFSADDGVGQFLKSIKDLILSGLEYLADLIKTEILPAFESFIDIVKEYYQDHGPALIKIYETIGKVLIDTVVVAIKAFLGVLETVIEIADAVFSAFEKIGEGISWVGNLFKQAVGREWIDSIKDQWNEVKSYLLENEWLKYVLPGGLALYDLISNSGKAKFEGPTRSKGTGLHDKDNNNNDTPGGKGKTEKEKDLIDELIKSVTQQITLEEQKYELLGKNKQLAYVTWLEAKKQLMTALEGNITDEQRVKLNAKILAINKDLNEVLNVQKQFGAKSLADLTNQMPPQRSFSKEKRGGQNVSGITGEVIPMPVNPHEEAAQRINEAYSAMADGVMTSMAAVFGSFVPPQESLDAFGQAMKSIVLIAINTAQALIMASKASMFAKGIFTGLISLITDAPLLAAAYVALEVAKGFVNGFEEGGFTGNGGKQSIAGVVHGGEWVAPAYMAPLFPMFESMRQGMKSGSSGGSLPYMSGGVVPYKGGSNVYIQQIPDVRYTIKRNASASKFKSLKII